MLRFERRSWISAFDSHITSLVSQPKKQKVLFDFSFHRPLNHDSLWFACRNCLSPSPAHAFFPYAPHKPKHASYVICSTYNQTTRKVGYKAPHHLAPNHTKSALTRNSDEKRAIWRNICAGNWESMLAGKSCFITLWAERHDFLSIWIDCWLPRSKPDGNQQGCCAKEAAGDGRRKRM